MQLSLTLCDDPLLLTVMLSAADRRIAVGLARILPAQDIDAAFPDTEMAVEEHTCPELDESTLILPFE